MCVRLNGRFSKDESGWVISIPSHSLTVRSDELLLGFKQLKDEAQKLSLVEDSECFLLVQDDGILYIDVKSKKN